MCFDEMYTRSERLGWWLYLCNSHDGEAIASQSRQSTINTLHSRLTTSLVLSVDSPRPAVFSVRRIAFLLYLWTVVCCEYIIMNIVNQVQWFIKHLNDGVKSIRD